GNFDKSAGDARENVMIYKNEPVKMGDYTVTYLGDSVSEPNHYYKVDYKRYDASGKLKEEFILKPNVQINKQITALPPSAANTATGDDAHGEENDDKNYDAPVAHEIAVGDTIRYRDGY